VGDVMAELTSVVARQGKEWSRRYRHRTPGYCGGWSSSMTTATGRARPSGVVREVADVEVRLQVKGEVEGSTESTGHGGVLSRSGTSSCVSWRAWAFLGASVLVSAGTGSVKGGHGHAHQGQGKLNDMLWLS
jgi:hypothetical protein